MGPGCPTRPILYVKLQWHHFGSYFWYSVDKKLLFDTQKRKIFFYMTKLENYVETFVCNDKMHMCSEYGQVITKHAMDMATALIIWVEANESSYTIAIFVNFFLLMCHITSLVFLWQTCHIRGLFTQIFQFLLFRFHLLFFQMGRKFQVGPFIGRG